MSCPTGKASVKKKARNGVVMVVYNQRSKSQMFEIIQSHLKSVRPKCRHPQACVGMKRCANTDLRSEDAVEGTGTWRTKDELLV